jgi:hypothetical protein
MVLYGQNRETECKTQDQGATGPILPLQVDVTLRSGLPSWSLHDHHPHFSSVPLRRVPIL